MYDLGKPLRKGRFSFAAKNISLRGRGSDVLANAETKWECVIIKSINMLKGLIMEQDTATTMSAMNDKKQNSRKGWKIATIIVSLVAVCGIGFGIYGMAQNSQNLKKDSQNTNPIYEGAQYVEAYNNGGEDHGMGEIVVSVANGETACFLTEREAEGGNVFGAVKSSENCSFSGVNGRVSKVALGTRDKQSIGNSAIAFLMEDGGVYYSDISEWKKEYLAKQYVSEKKAIDIVHVNYNFVIRFSDNSLEYIYPIH